MYQYTIYKEPNEEIFVRQCGVIETCVPINKKHDLLEDVDGSQMQQYDIDGGRIIVKNDYFIGYVGVDSDIELAKFFNSGKPEEEKK